MKYCFACSRTYRAEEWICPHCGKGPETIDGFNSFAPEALGDGGGFNPDHYRELVTVEKDHFWFRSRNRLIVWALKKFLPNVHSLLEIGCGTGFVLSRLAEEFPEIEVSGSELYPSGLSFAAERVPGAKLYQMDARQIPFVNEFDAIGAFDVLEHIPEDDVVLASVANALRPGGGVLLIVPQHRWLWSDADESACHVRRYECRELLEKIDSAGLRPVYHTSFVSLLMPAMVLSRFRMNRFAAGRDPLEELRLHPAINRLFLNVMRAELGLIRSGISLPMGGSLLVVAIKDRGFSKDEKQ